LDLVSTQGHSTFYSGHRRSRGRQSLRLREQRRRPTSSSRSFRRSRWAAYFGLAYYAKNADKLRVIPIDDELPDNGKGPVEPNRETIADGTYTPLGRPVFLYVSVAESERKEVADFIQSTFVPQGLSRRTWAMSRYRNAFSNWRRERFAKKQRGSVFSGEHSSIGLTIADLLEAEIVSVHADGK
jgi:hypothetical protein